MLPRVWSRSIFELEAGWTPEQVSGVFRVSSMVGPVLPGLRLVDLP
jgi:hypothetical protein